jgi:Ca-activated chloride channel homolog
MRMLADVLTERDHVAIGVTNQSDLVRLIERERESGIFLKYQRETRESRAAESGELLTVKARYKEPDGDTSQLLSRVLMNRPLPKTANLGFASAVAEFGMLLRESPSLGNASFDSVRARATMFRGEDEEGYRAQFVQLVDRAAGLREREPARLSRR